jgi:predicted CXXCH cytochrome family protein
MMLQSRAIALTALAWLAAVIALAARPAQPPAYPNPAPQAPVESRAPNPESGRGATAYVGSAACRRCHEDEHAQWSSALHLQMTKSIDRSQIRGDFRPGTHLEANGRSYTMFTRDGRYFITVAHQGRPPEEFEIAYTLGVHRYQGYLSKLPDGRIYVLPALFHVETGQWVDYKETTPLPRDPTHDLRQIWNVNCFNCHATNLAQNFDPATKKYATQWTEMGIGCEACHGPGAAHVALEDAWAARPETRPALDTRASNRQLGPALRIFSPRTAPPRQVYDMCSYCHGNKNNLFVGFTPGDRYEDYALPFLISEPIPSNDPQGDFWPDGRPTRFNRPQALTLSGCFRKGDVTCTNCHAAHGSKNDHSLKVPMERTNLLCTQCHSTLQDDVKLAAHTKHLAASTGSRCIECHMSDVNWRLMTRRRDHTMSPPVPELTAKYGTPNACTTCHDDKRPEWAAAMLDTWYGNRERRQQTVNLADTMYRAGSGDRAVIADLARLAVDRSHGTLVRASAAEFLGQLFEKGGPPPADAPGQTPSWLTSLIGAAADPEPQVRVMAVRALARASDQRAIVPLVAHLTDQVRSVRAAAAESLLRYKISQLPGPAGAALARAQDDYAASLRAFPDSAGVHAALAFLDLSRGRAADAESDIATAAHLDSSNVSVHFVRGLVHATAGRLDQALADWKFVQAIDPGYHDVSRLIEELQKRIPGRQ